MNIKELIEKLESVEDKEMLVCICDYNTRMGLPAVVTDIDVDTDVNCLAQDEIVNIAFCLLIDSKTDESDK